MPWPAWFRSELPVAGTSYIPSWDFPRTIEKCGRRGTAWRFHRKFTTYCPSRSLAFKALDRLAPETEAQFWEVMHAAKTAGLAPPTSYADLFLSCYRAPMPRVSVCAPFRGFRFGGWQEALRRGQHPGRVYQYDLNKAYRWSATCGLPDLRTAFPTWDFGYPRAIYLVRDVPPGAIPYRRVPASVAHVVTSEERDSLGLEQIRGITILRGVGFSKELDLQPTFDRLDQTFPPWIVSRVSRAFWGLWNTSAAPEVVSWKRGALSFLRPGTRMMKNPWANPIWSAFITSRVKLRINLHRARVLHCFVDSVHTTEELPTGPEPGDWRLVGTFDRFWVRAPGQWGDGEYTLKWSGAGSIQLSPNPLRR